MVLFEAIMTKYKGSDLIAVEPELGNDKRKVITYFHDKCCFHALDYKQHKKSQGCLIHQNDNGNIIADAREIIYPGSKGDTWWDTEQLLKQIKCAIAIHNCKMTTEDRLVKGIEAVLTEQGFNVSRMKAKCSPYWGWCKYCYCQVPKTFFEDSKQLALQYLDMCSLETIRCAYQKGLTGEAAEWTVKGQKFHYSVLNCVMMLIETMVNR
ncbi:hypothetical protein IW262DRAFT_1445509 [Armillaria fumosa]|nr:hypothetical protein IW262DRAFT_1445509 [Armillaria fumosa]